MTNNLKIVSEAFKNHPEFLMISFSVTPQIDSIPKLQSFAKSYGITAKNWHLQLVKKVKFINWHENPILLKKIGLTKIVAISPYRTRSLVDKKLRLRGIYNATLKLEMKQLKEDIALLIKNKKPSTL